MALLGIMIGGALGSLARYGTGVWLSSVVPLQTSIGVPVATLVVNVIGSFLLSAVVTLGLREMIPPALRLALATGFIGAFTTFSTFELESDLLFREGHGTGLALYVLGNLVLGYAAVLLGRALAVRIAGG